MEKFEAIVVGAGLAGLSAAYTLARNGIEAVVVERGDYPGAKNLTGGTSKMLPNHHITKPVFIGEIKANGQFDVVWKTPGLVAGDAWSKELEGSKDLIGDWVGKKCGNYNTKTNKCGGQGS